MKILRLLPILIAFTSIAYAQDIPNGVRYKKTSEEINERSKAALEQAIGAPSFPSNFFGGATVVGPMLWKALKPGAPQVLVGSKPVIVVIGGKTSFSVEGKAIRTDDERKAFWQRFRAAYDDLKSAKIRKGKAEEISYFWATIPFDIEEPFWVIETSTNRFIANFEPGANTPRLFWIDLVGDLEKLRP